MKITRRGVLGLLAGFAAAIGMPSVWIVRMKTYAGPLSDHFPMPTRRRRASPARR